MHRLFLAPDGSLRNGWKILAYLALVTALGALASPLYRRLPAAVHRALPGPWMGFLVYLLAAWTCLRAEGTGLASLGLRPGKRALGHLALGTLGGWALMLLTAALIWGVGGLHWTRTPGVGASVLLKGAWLYLGVALGEETLFRGYPFQRAVQGLGFTGAQVLFALFFALGHWHNPGMAGATKAWATLNIALAAVLLGFAWQRTGSLALPVGVHLGWNWTQGNLLGFGVSGTTNQGWWTPTFHGRPEWLTGGAFGLEASLPCALVCGAAALALWAWRRPGRGAGTAASAGASTAWGS